VIFILQTMCQRLLRAVYRDRKLTKMYYPWSRKILRFPFDVCAKSR
jgi:hypothetical protein